MATENKTEKPWGGRFTEATDRFVEEFTQSVSFDQRLAPYDIQGSIAHVAMLARAGVLAEAECDQITDGLNTILAEIEAGEFTWRQELEDVHMNIESALVDRVGEVGKKVHTGRSRNDQVATDLRLFLRAETGHIRSLLLRNMQALVTLAEQEVATLMPGYTHLQPAQPITFGHHVLAWYEMFETGPATSRGLPGTNQCNAAGGCGIGRHALPHQPVFERRVTGVSRRGGEFTGRRE